MEALYRKYREQGLEILSLTIERDRNKAIAFARKTFTFPLFLDARGPFRQFSVRGIPHTILIGRDGKVALRSTGYAPGREKWLEEEVKKLLLPL